MNYSSDMARVKTRRFLVLILMLVLPWMLRGEQIIVKLATLAPEGSPWHELLVEMGQKWREATHGDVVLRIYPGGIAGDERDMIRRIRIGQMHAAAVTTEGLTEISRDMNVFYIPLLVESFDELDALRDKLIPYLNPQLEKNGFKVLNWADVGWAYWFTREAISTPSDLRRLRLFNWTGDYHSAELWKKAGFHPVPLSAVDVLPSLETGLVEAFATNPMIALSMQWFAFAPNMLDMKWAPMAGALVISKTTWESIPEGYRENLMKISDEMEDRARDLVPKTHDAVGIMHEHGLEIHPISPENKKVWIELARSIYPHIRGTLVPEEIFDRAIRSTEEMRTQRERGQ